MFCETMQQKKTRNKSTTLKFLFERDMAVWKQIPPHPFFSPVFFYQTTYFFSSLFQDLPLFHIFLCISFANMICPHPPNGFSYQSSCDDFRNCILICFFSPEISFASLKLDLRVKCGRRRSGGMSKVVVLENMEIRVFPSCRVLSVAQRRREFSFAFS